MDTIQFLLHSIKNLQHQEAAYVALGELCGIIGPSITRNPMFDDIISVIKGSFGASNSSDPSSSLPNTESVDDSNAALQALGMIVQISSSDLNSEVKVHPKISKFAAEVSFRIFHECTNIINSIIFFLAIAIAARFPRRFHVPMRAHASSH